MTIQICGGMPVTVTEFRHFATTPTFRQLRNTSIRFLMIRLHRWIAYCRRDRMKVAGRRFDNRIDMNLVIAEEYKILQLFLLMIDHYLEKHYIPQKEYQQREG